MTELFIDTVLSKTRLALFDNEKSWFFTENSRKTSNAILKLLDDGLKSLELSPKDIKKIVYNRGPGSFTGIKLGSILSQGIAFDSDIEMLTYISFDLFESLIKDQNDTYLVMNAWQGDYFLGTKSESGWNVSIIKGKESFEGKEVYYLGDKRFCDSNWTFLEEPEAEIFSTLRKQIHFSKDLSPFYVKKSAAEINYEKRSIEN